MNVHRNSILKESPRGLLLVAPMIIGAAIYFQPGNEGWLAIMPAYMIRLVAAFLLFLNTRVGKAAFAWRRFLPVQTGQITRI